MNKFFYAAAFISLAVLTPPLAGEEPGTTQFNTVSEMMAALGEYTTDIGTFVPGATDTEFEMRPAVDEADDKATRVLRAKQAIIWAVYRTFIHTKARSVSITSTPQIFGDDGATLLTQFTQKVSVKRETALAVLTDLINEDSLDTLVTGDTWTATYDAIAIEEMTPGPDATFAALVAPSSHP